MSTQAVAAAQVVKPGGGANKQMASETKVAAKAEPAKPVPCNWGWKTEEELKELYSKASDKECEKVDEAKVAALKAKSNRPATLKRSKDVSFTSEEAAKIQLEYAQLKKSKAVLASATATGAFLKLDSEMAKKITLQYAQLMKQCKMQPLHKESAKAVKKQRAEAKAKYAERSAQMKKDLKYKKNAKTRMVKRTKAYMTKCKIEKKPAFNNMQLISAVGGCPKYQTRSAEFRRYREFMSAQKKFQPKTSFVSMIYEVGKEVQAC